MDPHWESVCTIHTRKTVLTKSVLLRRATFQMFGQQLDLGKLLPAVDAVESALAGVLPIEVGLHLAGGQQAPLAVGAIVRVDALVQAHVEAEAVEAGIGLIAYVAHVAAPISGLQWTVK